MHQKKFQDQISIEDPFLLPDEQDNRDIFSEMMPASIDQVGIQNLKIPFAFQVDEKSFILETNIDISVFLDRDKRGIHMSRLVRILQCYQGKNMDWDVIQAILQDCQDQLGTTEAKITLQFNYPIIQKSLRSGLAAYKYYKTKLEAICLKNKPMVKVIEVYIDYASTCPCSAALSKHAWEKRQIYAVPHAQRSQAIVRATLKHSANTSIESIYSICRQALKTETQIMVKREDEQAFAELNGQYLKFVEDAVRLLNEALQKEPIFECFEIKCTHYESLHSFDVYASIKST